MAVLKLDDAFYEWREYLRRYAAKNALTLLFLSVMFFISLVLMLLGWSCDQ